MKWTPLQKKPVWEVAPKPAERLPFLVFAHLGCRCHSYFPEVLSYRMIDV